jgi:hypothetical protein
MEPDEPPVKEPPPEEAAQLDALERFLVLLFLRRYVTWCARRQRFSAMEGAAWLFSAVRRAAAR